MVDGVTHKSLGLTSVRALVAVGSWGKDTITDEPWVRLILHGMWKSGILEDDPANKVPPEPIAVTPRRKAPVN